MITLLDAARCPTARGSDRAGREGRAAYETVEIDLANRPAWLYEKNPVGKVPVLEEDGYALPESAVIAEYLDERYPEPPLWPEDAGERASGVCSSSASTTFPTVLRAAARGGGRARAVRGRARRSRPPARGPELALRARVRAGGRRRPALGAAVGGRGRDLARPLARSLQPGSSARASGRRSQPSARSSRRCDRRLPARVSARRADVAHGCACPTPVRTRPHDGRVGRVGAGGVPWPARSSSARRWLLRPRRGAPRPGAARGARARRLAARRRLAGAAREARAETLASRARAEPRASGARCGSHCSRPMRILVGRAGRRDRPRPDRGRARRRRRGDPRPARLHRRLPCSRQSSPHDRRRPRPFVPVEDARGFDPAAVVLDGCGHLPSLQRPEDFGRHVEQAVERWT